MGMRLLKTKKHVIDRVIAVIFFCGVFISGDSVANDNNISLGKIRSVAIVGEFEPGEYDIVEMEPDNVKETWEVGEFDPRDILLTTDISGSQKGSAKIRVEIDIKVGEMKFDDAKGIDIKTIKKTASWKGRQILLTQEVNLKKRGKNTAYKYKYNFDSLMSGLLVKNKWPYILKFTICLTKDSDTKKQEKYITIIPDNKSNY